MGPTVLIVDDQPEFRRLARQLLESDGFTVVGESADAAAARVAVRELRPEVVLLDVRLPDGDGLDLARTIRKQPSAPQVVLTSTADYARVARDYGAAGFIAKAELTGPAVRALIEAV